MPFPSLSTSDLVIVKTNPADIKGSLKKSAIRNSYVLTLAGDDPAFLYVDENGEAENIDIDFYRLSNLLPIDVYQTIQMMEGPLLATGLSLKNSLTKTSLKSIDTLIVYSDHTRINAIGDGNCAFNAFVLALRDCLILYPDQLNKRAKDKLLADFNDYMDQHYSWAEFKRYLIMVDEEDLQLVFSPMLRKLAIDISKSDEVSGYAQKKSFLYNNLLAVFDRQVQDPATKNPAGPADDIFDQHPKIRKKISEFSDELITQYRTDLYKTCLQTAGKEINASGRWYQKILWNFNFYKRKQANQIAQRDFGRDIYSAFPDQRYQEEKKEQIYQEQIYQWWRSEGINRYYKQMAKPGVWAGDLELAKLGNFFGMNIDYLSQDITHGFVSKGREEADKPTVTLIHQGAHWSYLQDPKIPHELLMQRYAIVTQQIDDIESALPKKLTAETILTIDVEEMNANVKAIDEKISELNKLSLAIEKDTKYSRYMFFNKPREQAKQPLLQSDLAKSFSAKSPANDKKS